MNAPRPSPTRLVAIWAILLALLFLTWTAARFDLGGWNIVMTMSIAGAKMLLILLFFMRLRYAPRLTWIFVMGGFFWLFIMVALTMGDYLTRASLRFW